MGLDYDTMNVAILAVGDKSIMPAMVGLAKAFDIRVALAYEQFSACWSDKREEEKVLNERLMALAEEDMSIFCHSKDLMPEQQRSWEESLVDWLTKT